MTESQKRLLGLDLGDKRIGIAVSDEMGWMAHAVETLERTTLEKDLLAIDKWLQHYGITKIVVGVPRSLSGKITPQTQKVLDLIQIFKQKWTIPIEEWDEWFSTKEAERPLLEADMSRKKRKGVIDKLAAVIILQGYLDCHK